MATQFQMEVTLPTNGFYYPDGGRLKTVILRDITTREEKILLGSNGDEILTNIVKACIIEPQNLDIDSLINADVNCLLFKLRSHTYGPEYKVTFQCPNCNRSEIGIVNIDELPIYMLQEPFKPIEFELPVSGDTLTCKLLTQKDFRFINQLAKRATKNTATNRNQAAYTIRMAQHIKEINGQPVDSGVAQQYCQVMQGKDSAYFWWKIGEIRIGYDNEIEHVCSNCGNEFTSMLPINAEFFRPTFG